MNEKHQISKETLKEIETWVKENAIKPDKNGFYRLAKYDPRWMEDTKTNNTNN